MRKIILEGKKNMNLTQKEKDFLKDLADGEKLCRDKYKKHSECAIDPQLKNLFSELSAVEAGHYNTITQMQSGTVPNSAGGNVKPSANFSANYNSSNTPDKENDAYLCSDALSMEKHISHVYNTAVFEFEDENARRLLSNIEDAEQEHGKLIYDYMKINGMYN